MFSISICRELLLLGHTYGPTNAAVKNMCLKGIKST